MQENIFQKLYKDIEVQWERMRNVLLFMYVDFVYFENIKDG